MLTFKQYIAEHSLTKNNIVWHATNITNNGNFDPRELRPGSHVGSLKAALARARSDSYRDDNENTSRHDYVVHAYRLKSGKTNTTKDDGSEREMNRTGNEDITSYRNEVEDPGSTSHVIHNPDVLEYVRTFKAPKAMNRARSAPLGKPKAQKKSWWKK